MLWTAEQVLEYLAGGWTQVIFMVKGPAADATDAPQP
jgi:hypothetical protein